MEIIDRKGAGIKLVLSSSQSSKFTEFHELIQAGDRVYDYMGYSSLLFCLKTGSVDFVILNNNMRASNYSGAYITGYHNYPELAVAAATVLSSHNINYADSQLEHAMSMTKLTEYTRLAANGVPIPATYAGFAPALIRGLKEGRVDIDFPLILKRADADRGIDNLKVASADRLREILSSASKRSVWIIQEFIPNEGFYRLTCYKGKVASVAYRAVFDRQDGNEEKSHLNKPRGGANASLIGAESLPDSLVEACLRGCDVMGREFAGVDALIDSRTGLPYILEVNYNPQLATTTTMVKEKAADFIEAVKGL